MPAAGSGKRFAADRPKQYLPLFDTCVISFLLNRLGQIPGLKGIYVGLAEDDLYWKTIQESLESLKVPLITYIGGAHRSQTVLMGLQAMDSETTVDDWVLVHDAARPCVRLSDIEKLISEAGQTTDGAILALPVSDTLKRSDEDNKLIEKTLERKHCWRAQTPQFFPVPLLQNALERCLKEGKVITDEASAIEYIGGHPKLVSGHQDNIKITYADDLLRAECNLKQQLMREKK